jgi:PAS domain S-box-containing protein
MSLTYADRLKELRSKGDTANRLVVFLPWAGLCLAVAAFVAELLLPLRGGLGACYVLAVLTTFGRRSPVAILGMCGLSTLLALAVPLSVLSAGHSPMALLVNTVVTIAAIWATGACLLAFTRLSERLRKAEAGAQARQAWLAQTLASIGDGVIACDGAGRVEFMNEVAERLTGWSEADAVNKPIEEVFDLRDEDSDERLEPPLRRALAAGHIVALTERAVLNCLAGGRLPLDDSAAPIRNGEGQIIGAVMVFRDVSERRRLEQQMELRLREAGHRIRNVFANVRAIMTLCQTKAETPAELVNCIDSRMTCLMRSTDRLMQATEQGSSAREIMIEEIEPYLDTARSDGLRVVGDDVFLDASASVSLGMIVHELANNAAKYGSLSERSGQVSVTSHWQDDETFVIEWRETGGPAAKEPGDTGLGTKIISGLVRSQFQGSWESDYRDEGYSCVLTLTVGQAASRPESSATTP